MKTDFPTVTGEFTYMVSYLRAKEALEDDPTLEHGDYILAGMAADYHDNFGLYRPTVSNLPTLFREH